MPLTPPPSAPPAAPTAPGDAPQRANPGTFRVLADAFIAWLVTFRNSMADLRAWLADYIAWAGTHVTEIQALQDDVDAKAEQVATDKGIVQGISDDFGDLSGAITAANASASLSQDWATKTSGEVVTGQGYGAKKYAQDAAGSAASASGFSTSAGNFATQAGNYAAAAATGAKFYDTIALGNAGAADAATFGVKAGGSDGLVRPAVYRRESAGVSTLLYSVIPASEFDTKFPGSAPAGYAWSIADAGGNVAAGVKSDGTHVTDTSDVTTLTAGTINGAAGGDVAAAGSATRQYAPVGYAWSVADAGGNVAIGVKNDGTPVLSDLSIDAGTVTALTVTTINGVTADSTTAQLARSIKFYADICHIPTYGQSLSMGNVSVPPLTTTQGFDSLMFDACVRTYNTAAGSRYSALNPLVETESIGSPNFPTIDQGETPCSGTSIAIKQLLSSEDGITYSQQAYQLLFSVDGDGATISELSNTGLAEFQRLQASIQAGYNLAQAAGKTFNVPAFSWSQGENDYQSGTDGTVYKQAMETLRQSVDAVAKAATGQTNDVRMITYQIATHKYYSVAYPNIALAQLQATKDYPNIFLSTPMYMLDYAPSSLVHLTNISSKILGFYHGLAYKRIVIDKVAWKPLMPISKYKQGKIAYVKFNVPKGKLVFDTTRVTANTNMGFELVDSANNPLTISAVTITQPDTVRIVAAANITAGAKLRYAFSGTGTSGRTDGPRGNLRDQQGDTIVFDPSGVNYPAHNWCVMFEEIF